MTGDYLNVPINYPTWQWTQPVPYHPMQACYCQCHTSRVCWCTCNTIPYYFPGVTYNYQTVATSGYVAPVTTAPAVPTTMTTTADLVCNDCRELPVELL